LWFLLITSLTHFSNVFIYLFHFSTRFDQPSAHHQENQLYPNNLLVCITLCMWLSGMPALPDRHTRQSHTQWYIPEDCLDTVNSPDDEHWAGRNV
jgi:heme/copper-type cytochrome/quinol oxidase subunit 3